MVPASLAVWEGKVTQQILGGGKAGERNGRDPPAVPIKSQ